MVLTVVVLVALVAGTAAAQRTSQLAAQRRA
jgi:hypothetical protein